jgi:hypothetical protein
VPACSDGPVPYMLIYSVNLSLYTYNRHVSIAPSCLCIYLGASRIPDNAVVPKCSQLKVFAQSIFDSYWTCWTMPGPAENLFASARRIRSILSTRGISLADAARLSRKAFPNDRRFHIPSNLYYVVQRTGFSPGVHQLLALSHLSNYRLVDWFQVFGLVLDDIPRMQTVLPTRYTTLIDGDTYDDRTLALAFERRANAFPPSSLCPLSEWIRLGPPRRYVSADKNREAKHLYAKIGLKDALAFPDLLPGSIIRITKSSELQSREIPMGRPSALFLIEHAHGLLCTRLHILGGKRMVLSPAHLPFAQVELELGREARILGTVDYELRPSAFSIPSGVSRNMYRFWIPKPLASQTPHVPLNDLLLRARHRSGLTIREASAKTALIAGALQNPEFFCAPGALSDYEAQTEAPRHVHKILSLCILYSLGLWEMLTAAGLPLSQAGTAVIPDAIMDRTAPPARESKSSGLDGVPLVEFPYILGRTAAEFFGMEDLSMRDLFWFVPSRQSFHPYLADAILLIVDRRKKRVVSQLQTPLWAQPLYVLMGRDNKYVCTSCVRDGKTITIRPFSDGFDRPLRLKREEDIEVVGRVMGILRRPR